jgi:hypothetical protein
VSQQEIILWPVDASPGDIVLRSMELAPVVTTDIILYAGDASPSDIVLRDPYVLVLVSASGQIKVWLGAWTAKPVKVWTGAAWVTKPVKRWTGAAWVATGY